MLNEDVHAVSVESTINFSEKKCNTLTSSPRIMKSEVPILGFWIEEQPLNIGINLSHVCQSMR